MPGKKFEVDVHRVLEIQTSPTFLGIIAELQSMLGFIKHGSCTTLKRNCSMRKAYIFLEAMEYVLKIANQKRLV